MSCDRRCFDEKSKWFDHEDCSTCPGADKAKPMNWVEQSEQNNAEKLADLAKKIATPPIAPRSRWA